MAKISGVCACVCVYYLHGIEGEEMLALLLLANLAKTLRLASPFVELNSALSHGKHADDKLLRQTMSVAHQSSDQGRMLSFPR